MEILTVDALATEELILCHDINNGSSPAQQTTKYRSREEQKQSTMIRAKLLSQVSIFGTYAITV